MQVFVVMTTPGYEGPCLQGVYSTQEKADEALDTLDTRHDRFQPNVEERHLDANPFPSEY